MHIHSVRHCSLNNNIIQQSVLSEIYFCLNVKNFLTVTAAPLHNLRPRVRRLFQVAPRGTLNWVRTTISIFLFYTKIPSFVSRPEHPSQHQLLSLVLADFLIYYNIYTKS
jgi:hypothetical protein